MISLEDYDHWSKVVPWGYPPHVEQDLVLARLMVDIARHEALSGQLAFKGGTCLHKLWMPEPWRYSEDLDYTLIGNIKPDNLRDALKEIVHKAGFTSADWRTAGPATLKHTAGFHAWRCV